MFKYYAQLTKKEQEQIKNDLFNNVVDVECRCLEIVNKYFKSEITNISTFRAIKDFFYLELMGVKMEYTNKGIILGRLLDFQCLLNAGFERYPFNNSNKHVYSFVLQFTNLHFTLCFKTDKENAIKFLNSKDTELKKIMRVL